MKDNKKKTPEVNMDKIKKNTKVFASKLNKMIYNSLGIESDDLENTISAFDAEMFDYLNELETDTNGSIALIINRMNKYLEKNEKNKLESIEKTLKQNNNIDLIQSLYNTEKSALQIYNDYETMMTYIPDLKEAVHSTRDSIISPDDFTGSISQVISYSSNNNKSDTFIKYINETYDIEDKFDKIVLESLKKGKYYVLIKPYDNIFTDIVNARDKKNIMMNENTIPLNETHISTEIDELKRILNESYTDSKDKFTNSDIGEYLNEFYNNIDIYKNNITSEFEKSTRLTVDFLNENIQMTEYTKKGKRNTNDGFVENNKSKIDSLGLKGCYVELIEPQFIIPITVNDTTLGYYYIEAGEEIDKLNKLQRNKKFQNIIMNVDNKKSTADKLFKTLGDLLIRKMDKNFIKHNTDIKDQIYNIIKYNDNYKKKLKISYIDKEYMEEISINDGKGMLYYSLQLSKMYLALLITYVMLKVTKSFDNTIYYVKQGEIDDSISSLVNSALRSIQKKNFNFDDIISGDVGRIFKLGNGNLSKHVIPMSKSREKPIDIEVMSGQDTSINDDLMDMLLTLIRNSTGVPSVLLNYVNEADYSRTLVMANAKYVKTIMTYQKKYTKSLTRIYQKICKYELLNVDDDVTTINHNLFNVRLPKPTSLINSVLTDTLSNYDNLTQSLIRIELGEDDVNPKLKDILYSKIMKHYLPNIEMDLIHKFRKEAEIELMSDNIIKDKNDSENLNSNQW